MGEEFQKIIEAWGGIEPPHRGFADPSVSTSPPGQLGHFTSLGLKAPTSTKTNH